MNHSEPTLNELLASQAYLKDKIRSLMEARNCLPRNDKAGAHELLVEINRLQKEERGMRPTIAGAREREEKREQHSLWCACILELYGEEDLALCFEWMKQEKRNRKKEKNI